MAKEHKDFGLVGEGRMAFGGVIISEASERFSDRGHWHGRTCRACTRASGDLLRPYAIGGTGRKVDSNRLAKTIHRSVNSG